MDNAKIVKLGVLYASLVLVFIVGILHHGGNNAGEGIWKPKKIEVKQDVQSERLNKIIEKLERNTEKLGENFKKLEQKINEPAVNMLDNKNMKSKYLLATIAETPKENPTSNLYNYCEFNEAEDLRIPAKDLVLKPKLHVANLSNVISEKERKMAGKIAFVTMYAKTKKKGHSKAETYMKFAALTLQNIEKYTTKHGYPFFFMNDHYVNPERQAWWAKMDIIDNYFKDGYEWVVWTDLDVLILNQEVPMTRFLDDQYDFIGTGEWDHPYSIRSGFFAIRNSKIGRCFLNTWRSTYNTRFREHGNPEQDSLVRMVKQPKWKNRVKWWRAQEFHTYDSEKVTTKDKLSNTFSMHFPNVRKYPRIVKVLDRLHKEQHDTFTNLRFSLRVQQN